MSSNRAKKIVVGLGEALWDCLPEGRKLGGAPANFAYHAQAQGCEGYVVSAVGSDPLGDEIIEKLQAKGLHTEIARCQQAPTGTVKVTLAEGGIPSYDICQGVAWDNIPWSESLEQLAQRTDAVCFGTLAQRSPVSRHSIEQFISHTPLAALRIFDINLRQEYYSKELIESSLRKCNILKINDEEWDIVRPMLNIEAADQLSESISQLIQRYDLRLVILTCGTQGSHVFAADGHHSYQPTPKVEVADTVGAGDSFTGAFTSALLQGQSVDQAHALAVEISAYVCTQAGPMPDIKI